jgi:hypothetical protein
VEEFRETSSRIVIPEPFMDRGHKDIACDSFFDKVMAVNEDMMYGVSITAVGAISPITSCWTETVRIVCFKGMFGNDLEGSALDVT